MSVQIQNFLFGNRCMRVFVEPFAQGSHILKEAWRGKKIEVASLSISNPTYTSGKNLSLKERATAGFIGGLLIVPFVNIFVLKLLKVMTSDYVRPFGGLNGNISGAVPEFGEEGNVQTSPIDTAPISPEAMALRQREAIARLDQIERILPAGANSTVINRHFQIKPAVHQFNLQSLLSRYEASANQHQPTELYSADLLNWAEMEPGQRGPFQTAIDDYHNRRDDVRRVAVCKVFCVLVEYFAQMRPLARTNEQQNLLKQQFNRVVASIIDANTDCVNQMLSQLQTVLLDVVAEGDAMRGGRNSLQMKFNAFFGLLLCRYRTELLREILARQNPNFAHMPELERLAIQRLMDNLGIQGQIFEVGARGENLVSDAQGRIDRAIQAFTQEYKPVDYLLGLVRTYHGGNQVLRNRIMLWAFEYFQLANAADLDRRLSEDYDDMQASGGGNLTLAGVVFLLRELNILEPIGSR
jgi:hypothetical protein